MDLDPRVLRQPRLDLDSFVGGVVVHNQVQIFGRVGLGDLGEEPQELLVPVPRLAQPGDLAPLESEMCEHRTAHRRRRPAGECNGWSLKP